MNKQNKGITLIELLAVIVVLGIILAITSTSIINIVELAKKGAFKNTAYGIIKTSEYTHSLALIHGERINVAYTYNDGVETSIPENSKYKLNYTGEK
ncbi:MAG: type II secretion system protein, partial [Bacilli bacterium]|nr:type II secretion system protein [Bacilli bacterium]